MVRIFFSVFLVVVAGAFGLGQLRPVQDPAALTPTQLRQIASTLAEEGRWADLRDRLARLDEGEIPAASRAWWTVTLNDARWRAAAGSQNPDDGELQAARAALQTFLAAATPGQPHDEVWAQAQASLGDWHWRRPQSRNIHAALPHYQAALDFWAASPDIERARAQYLSIAFCLFEPDRQRDAHAWWLGQIPVKVVRDARAIAIVPAERARATLILARRLLQEGQPAARREAIGCLRELTGVESPTAGRDEALHVLARELEQNGEPRVGPDGILQTQPAFEAALVLYRRLVAEYPRGTSAWRDDAEEGIARILHQDLDVAVDGAFFPGSEVGYVLGWRNVGPIQLTLHKVDLARDVRFHDDRSIDTWADSVDVERIEPVQSWTHVPKPAAPHAPGRDQLRLARAPEPGAYVLVARSGQQSARALVLVGSTAVMIKTSGDQALVWCFDARTSEPLRSADVWFAERWWDERKRELSTQVVRTDNDGLARIQLRSHHESTEVFASVTSGNRTAFATCGRSWWQGTGRRARVLAFTDRAAYRPNQTVQWKAIARVSDGGAWQVPAGSKLMWKIYDPRGAVWKEDTLDTNAFGSISGSLELTSTMPLGEYQLDAYIEKDGHTIGAGRALLFRLEEYRLPEFEVSVAPARTGSDPGRPVLGDTLPIDVDVAFYSGGPVAGAAVEVVVTQRGWHRSWPRPYETRWGVQDGVNEMRSQRMWRDPGQVVLRQQLSTDARGHARFEIATPTGTGNLEYVVEARAVDASRREVVGSGVVRVGTTEYEVDVRTERRVYGPGRAVEIELDSQDVNGRPVAATGLLRLMQERWHEVWLDPRGNEIEGAALDEVRRASTQFPPPSSGHPWKRIVARWESQEIARFDVVIDQSGKASASVTPRKNGLYRAVWTSRDGRGSPVESEAWFHVADEMLRELGGVSDELELVVDRATVAPGETASVVLLTPVSGRYVLVTLEGLKLFDTRIVHVEGRAAFLRVPLTLDHVPDVYLNAFTANAGVPWRTSQEITVPPADRLLKVEVRPDQLVRLPGEEGVVEVLVLDVHGEPVQAEVALAVVDDALATIQADPTPEIGVFFHGDRRGSTVQTATTLDRLPFRRWILDQDGQLRDEREQDLKKEKDGGYRGAGDSIAPGSAGPRGRQEGAKLAAPMAAVSEMAMDSASRADESRNVAGGGELVVRSDFRETAFWASNLVTDKSGRARATFRYPDSLTRWRITARAATATTQVGEARSSSRTDKPLVARLAIPRFLVVEDVVTVSGLVDNKTEAPLRVRVELALDGPLALVGGRNEDILVPAGETARVDWLVRSSGAGTGRLVLRATSPGGSDALDKPLPCIPGGVDSLVARAGRVGPSGELALVLDVPGQRVREATEFTVDVAPSLAVTMLDALPYLVEYPYGCTEQTLSRFLPAAIVAHTLQQRGLSPDDALSRTYGGIEREHAAATHPKPGAGLAALDDAVAQGMRRLIDFQHGDGGWGWWKEGDSDRWMTAYVVWGLSLARDAGVDVPGDALQRGVAWLAHELVEAQSDAPLSAWMLHAIAASGMAKDDKMVVTALDKLLSQREALDAYGRSLAVLACVGFGRADDARKMAATLANGVQVDKNPENSRIGAGTTSSPSSAAGAAAAGIATAHWGADGTWRRWSDSPVETTAFALRALLAVDPAHPLAEPAMRWLVQNRRGASWSNTRDTAIAVLALDRWLDRSGELARDVDYELFVNGRSLARRTVTAAEMLRAPARFTLASKDVRDGRNEVRVVRTSGEGPLYVAAFARFTSLERPIPARGNQVFVRRETWKLVPRPTLLAGWAFDRVPLEDGGEVKSGERVIVVLTIEAKNDLEYLLLEDPRAAGFEAVDVKSGGPAFARELNADEVRRRFDPSAVRLFPDPLETSRSTGRQRWAHRELRDRHAAWFLDRLPQGVWELSYELVAEVPGRFRTLPARAEAMYVPEIRGHGTDMVVGVLERARDM